MAPARKLFLLVLMLAVLAPGLAAGQDGAAAHGAATKASREQASTMGGVLIRLARALSPDLPADLPPAMALSHLRARGLALTGEVDFAAPVTEGEAVRLAAAVAIRVRTDNPGTLLTAERVSALVGLLHDGLAGGDRP